jgi:hypothetical protein
MKNGVLTISFAGIYNRRRFMDFEKAKRIIGGVEVLQMIKKNQVKNAKSTIYLTF